MPAVISFVGHSGSGKTTLLEKLIKELKERGYRVATVKHGGHNTNLDEPGKDSWRHIQAGSEATIVQAHDRLMLMKPVAEDISLDEIIATFGENPDIVLVEGFKQSDLPKIEVQRKAVGPPLTDLKKLVAVASDEPRDSKIRQFTLEDVKGLTDFIEDGYIKPFGDRITLYINEEPIPLSKFPKEIVTNVLLAMATSLHGATGKITSLKLFLKKKG